MKRFLMLLLCLAPALEARSADRFGEIARTMQAFVDRGEVAGVVTLVASKDRVVHISAVGKSDLATGRPMAFDDPVAKYLPEFAGLAVTENGQSVTPSRAITIRDVLAHISGLPDVSRREPHLTLEESSRLIAQASLRFQPGSRWSYSTAGLDVMGRVVEVASGMPFDQFLQKRVLDPLGMKDTSFWIAATKKARWARSYQWMPQERTLRETTISYMYGAEVTDRGRPPLGGAGLFSTAGDVARFYQMMLNKGVWHGRRVLTVGTVAELTRKQTGDLAARPGMPWGLGFCVVEDPQAMEANMVLSPGSFGHGGAYSTQSWADPVRNLIWIVMFERNGKGNPDNSDVRIAFQEAVVAAN